MSWDLDDIIDAADGDDDEPRLVQVGAALRRGRPATAGCFWSTGRVFATVGAGWVRIRRRWGNVGEHPHSNELRLAVPELRAVDVACRDWARRRDAWAAFYYSSAGYPAGYGRACYYQAPGKRGERITIGTHVGALQGGEGLGGRDAFVRLKARVKFRGGIAAVAEIWRRGERFGPKDGSRIGLRYLLRPGLYLDAKREEARVWRRGGGEVFLEPGEEAFVAALLSVVRRHPGRAPGARGGRR
jgi:hypothetical protein